MFKKIVILLFVSLVILTGCTSLSSSNKWTETVGVIHNVTELNDGKRRIKPQKVRANKLFHRTRFTRW